MQLPLINQMHLIYPINPTNQIRVKPAGGTRSGGGIVRLVKYEPLSNYILKGNNIYL
jgi:hypothetical protein